MERPESPDLSDSEFEKGSTENPEKNPEDPEERKEPKEYKDQALVRDSDLPYPKEQKETDPFQQKFTVFIPAELPNEREGMSEGQKNRQRMFEMRQAFARTESGKRYTWVPQALEAYQRSLTSDFLPNFGTIRSLQIDPETETMLFTTKADTKEHPLQPADFEFNLSLRELSDYSLELALAEAESEAEKTERIPEFNYSPEMRQAIENLTPSARYYWDLCARASYLESQQRNRTTHGEFKAKMVAPDLLSRAEGVGVFLYNERDPRAHRFSAAKVVREDVPLTKREQDLFRQQRLIYHIEEVDPRVKEIMDLRYDIKSRLADVMKHKSSARKIIDRLARSVGQENAAFFIDKLDALGKQIGNHQLACYRLTKRMREEIYTGKISFHDEKPFEIENFSPDLQRDLEEAVAQWAHLLEELDAFLNAKKAKLLPLCESALASSKPLLFAGEQLEDHEKRMSRKLDSLAQLTPHSAGSEAVRGLLQEGSDSSRDD